MSITMSAAQAYVNAIGTWIHEFRHRFSAYLDRFTLLLALDCYPALRNVLETAGLWSGRSKL